MTLLAHEPMTDRCAPLQKTAWYTKVAPIFGDALALVRRQLWTRLTFPTSPSNSEVGKVPRALIDYLTELLCYAA